ncbi:hypothetical protein J6590_080915 [Homalodisca vitripennis]|nr:hypothetical protein J6590_080915 [Homalodisca vitripennis]
MSYLGEISVVNITTSIRKPTTESCTANVVAQARAGYLDRAVDTSGESELWFRRFKDGDADTEGKERQGRLKRILVKDKEKLRQHYKKLTNHFHTSKSHGNDPKARKLGTTHVEAKICQKASFHLRAAAPKVKKKRFLLRIVTGDENINIDCEEKHAWMKMMINICWHQVGGAFWELILLC